MSSHSREDSGQGRSDPASQRLFVKPGQFALDIGSFMSAPPPVVCEKILLYVFLPRANIGALTKLCQSAFDEPSGGYVRCWPIDERVVLQFGKIEKVGPEPGPATAYVEEMQALIHISVGFSVGGGSAQSAYFTPYIWVDNPLSMAGGREVFGYPKGLGRIVVPDVAPGESLSLSLKTLRGDANGGIWTDGLDQIVIDTQTIGKPSTTSLDTFLNQLRAESDPHVRTSSRSLFEDSFIAGNRKEIFLKQFRAIDSTGSNQTAAFQQIATADYVATGVVRSDYPYYFDFMMANFDSAPMVTRLGMGAAPPAIPPKTYSDTLMNALRFDIEKITLGDPPPIVLWQMGVPAIPSNSQSSGTT